MSLAVSLNKQQMQKKIGKCNLQNFRPKYVGTLSVTIYVKFCRFHSRLKTSIEFRFLSQINQINNVHNCTNYWTL